MMTAPWIAKPACPAYLREVLERFVNGQNAAWRLPPAPKGEVFDSFEQCRARLNVYAMVEGFAVVVRGQGNLVNAAQRFQCIHYHNESRNDGDLELRVERDPKSKIISKRQREVTSTKQKDYKWYIYCSLKDINKRGSGVKGYYLIAKELSHSHRLISNPLIYTENQDLILEYRQLAALA
jgi:hypothetical protein